MTLTVVQEFTGDTTNAPLHIPINIELISQTGEILSGKNSPRTLELIDTKQSFIFDDIEQGSIAVLLGDFSAPIKLKGAQTSDDLVHILSYSRSDFSRWDSAQQLLTNVILDNSKQTQMSIDAQLLEAVNIVLNDNDSDPALIALALELPADMALFELETPINVDGLLNAKKFVKQQIALHCAQALQLRYEHCVKELLLTTSNASALRSLKMVLMSYLCAPATPASTEYMDGEISQQFADAQEMTESINALTLASQYQLPCFETLSDAFSNRWHDNGLVMDKWFMTIGQWPASDVLNRMADAMGRPSFSWQNPNRVRSLIGAFAQGNAKQFHQLDGSGYRYLTQQLIKLNDINPQIAARLITPLLSWHKFDSTRSALMKSELTTLSKLPTLSKDLLEKVTLSLSQ